MLVVFFFAFLGTEYLFDNCMMYVTDASGVVRAQNQMLGVSAIGFLLYNWFVPPLSFCFHFSENAHKLK